MIPRRMKKFLEQALPDRTWQRRLKKDGPLVFMEFGPLDVDRLSRLGIEVDKLGPYLVSCMWNDESDLEIGGYLVVDNLAMGRPSMGGIRMLPDVTPSAIFNLARGMTLKNAAADLPYGGGKSGIVAPDSQTPEIHREIVTGFAHLLARYGAIYLPGPDVGTNDEDMKTIAIENGLGGAVSKTVDMGGNRIDQLGAAAQGVVVAARTLMDEIGRLKVLPQFADLKLPEEEGLTVLIQGFGAVGTHAARLLVDPSLGRSASIVGISDASGYLYNGDGLPVDRLIEMQSKLGDVAKPYYQETLSRQETVETKFSTCTDDLLRESAYCLIPAAPVARYLDVDEADNPSMTVERMGKWRMIVEGANTYSSDPDRKAARARMERSVYWQKGVMIATDFLVNSGGVIFAAQEQIIKAPEHLQIPDSFLGNRQAVNRWLGDHREEFAELAERRRLAGLAQLNRVIPRNIRELIDLLVSDSDLLPCEAAERIGISRVASSEGGRTVGEVMVPIQTVEESRTVRQAAETLIDCKGSLLAVVSDQGDLVGVVTEWNITQASATGCADDVPVSEIMTREVISAAPDDNILEVVRKLELYEISAMPVVTDEGVTGLISADTLARKTLYRLLQTQG